MHNKHHSNNESVSALANSLLTLFPSGRLMYLKLAFKALIITINHFILSKRLTLAVNWLNDSQDINFGNCAVTALLFLCIKGAQSQYLYMLANRYSFSNTPLFNGVKTLCHFFFKLSKIYPQPCLLSHLLSLCFLFFLISHSHELLLSKRQVARQEMTHAEASWVVQPPVSVQSSCLCLHVYEFSHVYHTQSPQGVRLVNIPGHTV